jgi:diacylglycerol kinase (ATP)
MKQDAQASQDQMDARNRHAKRLKKVEKARARLEKASRKLRALENEIAALVCRSSDPRAQPPGSTTLGRDTERHARLIFNPQSKGAQDGTYRLEAIVSCLRSYGFAIEVGTKTSGKVARELAKTAVEQDTDLVIVAAGDGTIEDVVGQLVGTKTALGILPIGTMNNLARALGVPLNLEDACTLLAMGTTRYIDVGRVITSNKRREGYFLETAGVGLSALAAPMGQDAEKGRWALLLKALGKALAFKAANVAVSYDDGDMLESQTQLVTVSNAPLFGMNLLVAPDAKMDDGLLDLALYDGMGKMDLERHFLAISEGKRVGEPRISFHRVKRVRIAADKPIEANADLHILAGQQTWEIDVLPRALAVVAGNSSALTLPVDAAPPAPPLAGPQQLQEQ